MDIARPLLLVALLALVACGGGSSSPGAVSASGGGGGGGGGGNPVTDPPEPDPDDRRYVRALIDFYQLDGDAADGRVAVAPDDDPQVDLGMTLFFSRTLSGRMDVACASCHLPTMAGGDNLTLPVGVGAVQPEVIGLGRRIDPALDVSPRADGGPNVPRHSQSILNVSLYSRALFHDGRVFVLDAEEQPGGAGQSIATPDSGTVPDPQAGADLLEAQSLFPMVSNDEMRGYMYPQFSESRSYRDYLVDRLKGNADQDWLAEGAAQRWRDAFERVYGFSLLRHPVRLERIQAALAAYQRALVFTRNDWLAYVSGDESALTDTQVLGARLFLAPKADGGLGCVSCHASDHFTDEQFHNVAFPQIGKGKRADGSDHGRGDVNPNVASDSDRFAFRTPTLLNVAASPPYGHTGSFASLEAVIAYHAHPRAAIDSYDFSLMHLPQAQLGGVDGRDVYPEMEALTRETMAAESFLAAEQRLPGRLLSHGEVDALAAFLSALTDPCVVDSDCMGQWMPDAANNPDGNMLVSGEAFPPGPQYVPGSYPSDVTLSYPMLAARAGFADMDGCVANAGAANSGAERFIDRAAARNADLEHGFDLFTWFGQDLMTATNILETMMAGGVALTFADDDCWLDIVFAGGDQSGTRILRNRGGQAGFDSVALFADDPGSRIANVSVADINGDYRREILFGNLHDGAVPVMAQQGDGRYVRIAQLPMERSTFGMAFGNTDSDGYPDIYMTHWGGISVSGQAPVFWRNDGSASLTVADAAAGVSQRFLDQEFQFSPGFVDVDDDGDQDLLVASDFGTSITLQNDGDGTFLNVTDRAVISDEFGMGAAIGDFDNDLKMDWFVSSIHEVEPGQNAAFCSDWTGNRLYRNASAASLAFEDVTEQAGVRDGGWGWGACAADFNNDGALDIYHGNGINELPLMLDAVVTIVGLRDNLCLGFAHSPPRLFINDGSGRFTSAAADWGLDAEEDGRGVACGDYDRDGDVDIVALGHSEPMRLLENQVGSGSGRHFINVRLEGLPPNTEALGAKVIVSADLNNNGVLERGEAQIRVSSANSNFASQNAPELHFGLGAATVIDTLTVQWPQSSAPDLVCHDVAINTFQIFSQRENAGQGRCP